MSTVLALRFPLGRYHATPWGHNVNEALVEWPPSPWRILRALYATWRCRAPHLAESSVHGLLTSLATPPDFELPAHVEAHTRHYFPDIAAGTDKAIDAFAAMERGATVVARWSVDLPAEQRTALTELAVLLPYLGRAESLCDSRLLEEGEATEGMSCRPLHTNGGEGVRVLVPTLPLDIEALTARTVDVRRQRHIDPPGATWIKYAQVPMASPTVGPRRQARADVSVVRWSIDAAAPPAREATVAMTDVLRQACLKRFGLHLGGGRSATLAGKDESGVPLQGHSHAHYLAFSGRAGPLLDTLVAWAPGGFDSAEVSALGTLNRLWGRDFVSDFRPCHLFLEAYGTVDDAVPELVGPATVWESHTPFAPPRHAKRRMSWLDHLEVQVSEELERRGHPAPRSVRPLPGSWSSYRTYRPSSERLSNIRRVAGLQLVFDEPVSGPLPLGALSHFGLGLFLPARA